MSGLPGNLATCRRYLNPIECRYLHTSSSVIVSLDLIRDIFADRVSFVNLSAMILESEEVLAGVVAELARRDAKLDEVLRQVPPLRLRRRSVTFETLAGIIVGQQLSAAAAQTIHRRVSTACNGDLCPQAVLALPPDVLRDCGLSRSKILFLEGLARHLEDNPSFLDLVGNASDDEAYRMLTAINGIGPWSAQIFLLFAMGRSDIFPKGDGSLERAIKQIYGARAASNIERHALRWKPYRSAASLLLWAWVDRSKTTPQP
jgi:DNA-3-methyladenine glycosylase II